MRIILLCALVALASFCLTQGESLSEDIVTDQKTRLADLPSPLGTADRFAAVRKRLSENADLHRSKATVQMLPGHSAHDLRVRVDIRSKSLEAETQQVTLELQRNMDLIPKGGLPISHIDEQGNTVTWSKSDENYRRAMRDVHYIGTIRGLPNSVVAVTARKVQIHHSETQGKETTQETKSTMLFRGHIHTPKGLMVMEWPAHDSHSTSLDSSARAKSGVHHAAIAGEHDMVTLDHPVDTVLQSIADAHKEELQSQQHKAKSNSGASTTPRKPHVLDTGSFQYVLEWFIVADKGVITRWGRTNRPDPSSTLTEHLLTMGNMADAYFRRLAVDGGVRIKMKGFQFWSSSDQINTVQNVLSVLNDFRDYMAPLNTGNTAHDTATLYTTGILSIGNVGQAIQSGSCTANDMVNIVQDRFVTTDYSISLADDTVTSVHEIGHNIGSPHEEDMGCTATGIMASAPSYNTDTWSACSTDRLNFTMALSTRTCILSSEQTPIEVECGVGFYDDGSEGTAGYRPTGTSTRCKACHASCVECTGTATCCTRCAEDKVLLAGSCVDSCSTGTYKNFPDSSQVDIKSSRYGYECRSCDLTTPGSTLICDAGQIVSCNPENGASPTCVADPGALVQCVVVPTPAPTPAPNPPGASPSPTPFGNTSDPNANAQLASGDISPGYWALITFGALAALGSVTAAALVYRRQGLSGLTKTEPVSSSAPGTPHKGTPVVSSLGAKEHQDLMLSRDYRKRTSSASAPTEAPSWVTNRQSNYTHGAAAAQGETVDSVPEEDDFSGPLPHVPEDSPWQPFKDENNYTYWYNESTQQSQWERPAGV